MTTWVIERYLFDEEDEENLIKEVRAQGCGVIELNPMKINTLDPPTSLLVKSWGIGEKEPVIYRGSLNVANTWGFSQVWNPGVIYTKKNFKCSKYYAYWNDYLLNDTYVLLPSNEVIKRISNRNTPSSVFIRPDSGDKIFSGGICNSDNVHKLLREVSPNELVVMDSFKYIESEYRFIISTLGTPHIVTHSHYKGEISRVFPIERLLDWVKDLLDKVQFHPDSLYVLDIGIESLTNKIRVIELNSFSCSDWYKCDLKLIVSEANQLAEREFKMNSYEL